MLEGVVLEGIVLEGVVLEDIVLEGTCCVISIVCVSCLCGVVSRGHVWVSWVVPAVGVSFSRSVSAVVNNWRAGCSFPVWRELMPCSMYVCVGPTSSLPVGWFNVVPRCKMWWFLCWLRMCSWTSQARSVRLRGGRPNGAHCRFFGRSRTACVRARSSCRKSCMLCSGTCWLGALARCSGSMCTEGIRRSSGA